MTIIVNKNMNKGVFLFEYFLLVETIKTKLYLLIVYSIKQTLVD